MLRRPRTPSTTVAPAALAALAGALLAWPTAMPAQSGASARSAAAVPPIADMRSEPASELREAVERYSVDRQALTRRYDAEYSPERRRRFQEFYTQWRARLREVDFDRLGREGQADYVLLDNKLRYELELLRREEKLVAEMRPLIPFADRLIALQDTRRRLETIDPQATAKVLTDVAASIDSTRKALEAARAADRAADGGNGKAPSRIVAYRAADALNDLQRTMQRWYGFYSGYDPMFTWWAADPYKRTDDALKSYVKFLRERIVGWKEGEDEPIVGDPIGADGLKADLEVEMIPYTPQELIGIAEREYAWLEGEMKKASREMGFGDDWKKALEKVKNSYVEPGKQTALARDLAREAVQYITERDLVTVPPLADEVWRMEMMSPAQQKVAPFFLGGEVILVAYPTDGMEHADKMMSLRGNNPHFSRAVVHHELIPGHHLQGFMSQRYNSHRRAFSTPFWSEGNALYWEFVLYDMGFPKTPEDRVGMLFWRMHRAARIIFSLSFHLGTMTPQQAIDFLVDRVGHERANAAAEVRRSFNGTYSPLYQAAYMLGGLQQRALRRELVDTKKMTDRQFHDAILRGGPMPIEIVRARLTNQRLTREYRTSWRFAGE